MPGSCSIPPTFPVSRTACSILTTYFPFLGEVDVFLIPKLAFLNIGKTFSHKASIRVCHLIFQGIHFGDTVGL